MTYLSYLGALRGILAEFSYIPAYPGATRHHDWRSYQKFSEGAAQALAQARYGKVVFLRCDWMRTFRACSDALETAYVKESPDSLQLV